MDRRWVAGGCAVAFSLHGSSWIYLKLNAISLCSSDCFVSPGGAAIRLYKYGYMLEEFLFSFIRQIRFQNDQWPITQLPWRLLIILIILLSGLVGPRVFQLAVKLSKIFDQKYKSNWKVQAIAPRPGYGNCHFYTGRPNVNKIDSSLGTSLMEEIETRQKIWGGARVR